MGKSYIENSLKRFLKRKVKITMGVVVTFLITGMVSFAEGTAEEGSTQWHKEQAESYLSGIKDGTEIKLDKDITAENVTISSDGAGGIKVTFSDKEIITSKKDISFLTGKVIQNSLNLMNGEKISEITDVNGYNEGFYLNNVGEIKENDISITISGEGNIFVNEGTLEKGQIGVNGATIVNKGIINSKKLGQKIEKQNGKAYNYGLIISNGADGQEVTPDVESAELYNYGIITGNGNIAGQKLGKGLSNLKAYNYGLINLVQFGQHTAGGTTSKVYNYGIIKSKGAGQYIQGANIGYNYGIIENETQSAQIISNAKAIGYNYGIIKNTSDGGQQIEKGGTGYNYGVIENQGNNGQNINADGGTAYNYGIIKNSGKNAINAGTKGQAYNYGVIDFRNNTTTNIFGGNVKNNGIVITTTENLDKKLTLGTGENKGVVLDSSFELKKTGVGEVNNHVTDLTSSGIINIANGKTYYTKDKNVEFKNDLTGNVLTAVVKSENKNPIFNYTGDDELILKDSSVMGYFLASGTLLGVEEGKELVLVNSNINTVVGVGSDVADVTAVNLNSGTLTLVGESDITGKVVGKGTTKYVSVHSDNQNIALESGDITLTNDDGTYGLSKTNTEVTFNTIKADNLNLEFTVDTNTDVNKVTLNNAELKSIDGSSSTEKIELTADSTENIGNITLGKNDDKFTVTNSAHNGIIDMGTGNDEFNVSLGAVEAEHKKEAGNTFDYKVNGAEKIVLNGEGWHIGENAELNGGTTTKAGEKTELHIADKGSLHVDMNNNYGKGNVTTSLDKMASGADLSVTTGTDAEVKFVVGDKFNVSEKQFEVAHDYSVKDANLGAAVIFKGTGKDGAVEEKDGKIALTVKDATEYNGQLDDYKSVYDAMLAGLSGNEELKNAVNHSDESKLVGMITKAGNTAEAFYTTGYAVTKDVTDTYMSVVDDFGRKAGKGEWIAYGKYVNSDTEFDGGKASKGYDGDITGTVGMLEYGVNDTTSYGVVYGQGDTEVDIQGGGKLDGDNTYFGGYVKHRTQGGFDLTGNVGYTKSELDLNLATSAGVYNMITSGKSDADALTFALKGKKDYLVTDTVKLQPVFGARYTLINQDAVESSDANYRMDEQDVTIFEGILGGNAVKEFDLYNGKLSLSVGAEYVLADVSKSDDARYTLYGKEIALTGEEDIADNRIEGHIGIDYEHESGVGVDTKYEMIWTDKGDNSRVTAGISYRF